MTVSQYVMGERVAELLRHMAVSKKSYVRIPVPPKVLGSDGIVNNLKTYLFSLPG